MTRHVALYRTPDGEHCAQGPFPDRRTAAYHAARIAAEYRDTEVEVVEVIDREVELGHVPMGVDGKGDGPVRDEDAVRWMCLECGCPAVAPPPLDRKNSLDRLTEDIGRVQADIAEVRRDFQGR